MDTKTEKLKIAARRFFRKHRQVKCPAFKGETIAFNSKGINHLFYKGNRSARDKVEIESRIELLPRVINLLEIMPLAQEEDFYIIENKKIKFWAFEGVVNGKRIKVVVKQTGQGKKHFWSVIPGWRSSKFGRKNSKKSLSKEA